MVRKISLSIVLTLVLFLLVVPGALAMTIDNVKDSKNIPQGQAFTIGETEVAYNEIWEKYQPIEVTNIFGLGKTLFRGAITQHDDICAIDCSSTMQIYLGEDSVLIDEVDFYTILKDGTRYKQDIRSYQFYSNGEEYKLGTVVPSGIYEVKLEAKKEFSKTVDWVIKTQGEILESWAEWESSFEIGLISYYNLNDDLSTTSVLDSLGINNGTLAGGDNTQDLSVAGKIQKAFNFNGIDDDVNLSFIPGTTDTWTWIGWINTSDTSGHIMSSNGAVETEGVGIRLISNKLNVNSGAGASTRVLGSSTTTIDDGEWHFFAVVYDGTNGQIFVDNGGPEVNTSWDPYISAESLHLSRRGDTGTDYIDARIDEVAIYNRSFSSSEVIEFYNDGDGISYRYFPINLTLNSPINYYNSTNNEVLFNCSASSEIGVTNVSFFLDGVLNETNSSGINNTDYIFSRILDYDTFNWSCDMSNGVSSLSSETRQLTISKVFNNLESYNSTTYETKAEGFRINISSDGSELVLADLVYDGTAYTATKVGDNSEMEFNRNIIIPTVSIATAQNKSFYWNVTYGTEAIATTTNNQSVGRIALGLCNSTLTVPYINLTFKDEETNIATNASIDTSTWTYYLGDGTVNKTLLYSTTNANESYGFCFIPSSETLTSAVELQYSDTGYPQRRWSTSGFITNITTTPTLYMLASADGTYSVYQVQDTVGNGIQGVAVVVERQFVGVWTLVEQGTTDSAGGFTGWLNPDYDHRLTFTKSGLTTVQVTVRPSSSTYTIVMGGGDSAAAYNSSLEGLSWFVYPNLGQTLFPNSTQIFLFNITSNKSSLVSCKMEIVNNNSISLGTTIGCNSQGGNLSLSIPLGTNRSVRAIYSINTGSGYYILDADAYWIIMTTNIPERGTLTSFFKYARELNEFGNDNNRQEFSRVVFFFLMLAILMAFISITTGWDLITTGGSLVFMNFIIVFGSYAGFLTLSYTGINGWMDQYVVALITSLFTIGFIFNKMERRA